VRNVGRKIAIGLAVAAMAGLAAGLPALASTRSVELADGTSLTVWEQRGRAVTGRGQEPWSINYSVTDASGTRPGVVPPTADAARDSAPFLSTDVTGSIVLVWSRLDGPYQKIAYTRFSGGAWTNFHYLTFGPGDDDEPRIGTGMTGSFLFFHTRPDKYQYVPLDLVAGRLFAPPRSVELGSARRDISASRQRGSAATEGGTVDIPVVNRCGGNKTCSNAVGARAGLLQPGGATTQGGTVDIPVVNNRTKGFVWGVGSSGDCSPMVLVIPSHDLAKVFVFRFASGLTSVLERVSLPSKVEDRFGEGLAASYLPLVCN
jgi:hypothetical protein